MTPRLLCILFFILGLGLWVYSLTLPYYTDQKAVEELRLNSYNLNREDYYHQEAQLRTNKTTWMDLGAGITIATGTILLFLLVTKTKTIADFKNLRTLSKFTAFTCANTLWLLLIPGTIWYYSFRGARGDFPPFADSIGLPIMGNIAILLLLVIPLNIFLVLTTLKTNLPTKLFIKPTLYTKSTIAWEVFFSFWLLINLICLVFFVIDGDHISIIINLFFTFLLLTLRAGQMSKYT